MPITATRLAEIQAIPDSQIDTSDIPEATQEFFKKAKLAPVIHYVECDPWPLPKPRAKVKYRRRRKT